MSSPPSPDLVPSPHVPTEWEVLSMSTMSASSLSPPLQQPPPDDRTAHGFHPLSVVAPLADVSATFHPSPELSATKVESSSPDVSEVPHPSLPDGSPLDVGFSYSHPQKNTEGTSWWRQPAEFLRLQWSQAAKPSTVWSIALFAALVGVVAVGYRWRHERYQNQQLRLELIAKDEKLNDLAYQVNHLKEAMTGRRRVGLTRSSFF